MKIDHKQTNNKYVKYTGKNYNKSNNAYYNTAGIEKLNYQIGQSLRYNVLFGINTQHRKYSSSKKIIPYCSSDLSEPIKKKKEKNYLGLYFEEKLTPSQENYINSLKISENRKKVLKKALLLRYKDTGECFLSSGNIESLILNKKLDEKYIILRNVKTNNGQKYQRLLMIFILQIICQLTLS